MKLLHSCLSSNNILIKNSISQKHLGLTIDVKLNFVEHIKNITQKIGKTMGLLGRFQPILPRFIRSPLGLADAIYDQT